MKISVYGDSISTYEGYNPQGYLVYYDKNYQRQNHLTDVSLTWWHRVITFLGGELCVNNSYSGSKVSGISFPAGTSMERIDHLGDPDVILVFLGLNDYGYAVPLRENRKENVSDIQFFAPAYECMLSRLRAAHPSAEVMVSTLMMSRMKEYDGWGFPTHYRGGSFEDFNDVIRSTCRACGCMLVDTASQGIRYQSLDGTHPDEVGHEEIAVAWINCLKEL